MAAGAVRSSPWFLRTLFFRNLPLPNWWVCLSVDNAKQICYTNFESRARDFLTHVLCVSGLYDLCFSFLEVRYFRRIQLKLKLISNQRNKFGIGAVLLIFYITTVTMTYESSFSETVASVWQLQFLIWGFLFCLKVCYFRRLQLQLKLVYDKYDGP